ncbi:MAG: thioredoxin TrxC [Burkholderiaceae bacterium]|nr:thioredoxin TrxC [Burkholderiaceae bacterium]
MSDPIHAVCPHCGKTNRLPAERVGQHPDCGACGQALFPGKPVEMDDARFQDYLRRTDLPVVVDFWASWCGPCRMMAPQFEQAARKLAGRVQFLKVDTDANPGLSQRYAIRSIPTIALFQGGREVRRSAGAMTAAQIEAWIGA